MTGADPRLMWELANRASRRALALDRLGAPFCAGICRAEAKALRAAASAGLRK